MLHWVRHVFASWTVAVYVLASASMMTATASGHQNTASSLLDRLDPSNSHIILRGGDEDWVTVGYQEELNTLTTGLKDAFGPQKVSQLVDTLAVMIVFSYSFEQPFTSSQVDRLAHLHCSLYHLANNIAPYTKLDVYLWVAAREISRLPSFMRTLPGMVYIVPIPESSWQDPPGTTFNVNWNYASVHDQDYYLMGRWRNTFAFAFVREMGYQYMLQLDDDTFAYDEFPFDIVQRLRNLGSVMGIRSALKWEPADLVAGLPELARYWMVTRNVSVPIGPLFELLTPPNISGLYSGGWDPLTFQGCFVIFDINFWFHEVVQDFVNLVLKTGSDAEQRWNDQSVQNMVRLLFVPWDSVCMFGGAIFHSKIDMDCFPDLGCESSLSAVGYQWPLQDYLSGSQISVLVGLKSDLNLYCFSFVDIPDDNRFVQQHIFLSGVNRVLNTSGFLQEGRDITPEAVAELLVQRWRQFRLRRVAIGSASIVPDSCNEGDTCMPPSLPQDRDQAPFSPFNYSFEPQLILGI
jgi:hypothetical protein